MQSEKKACKNEESIYKAKGRVASRTPSETTEPGFKTKLQNRHEAARPFERHVSEVYTQKCKVF
jgi:hypothetical protein